MIRPVAIVGAGGQGRTVADILLHQQIPPPQIKFVDDDPAITDAWKLETLKIDGFIAGYEWVVAIGANEPRRRIAELLVARGATFVTPIHPTAVYNDLNQFGYGTTVHAHAFVGYGVKTGPLCIVNNFVSLGHGVRLGYCVNVCDGTVFGGDVVVEDMVYIGLNATILPKVRIGEGAIIGAGAVVTKDVPPGETWVGNPARPVGQ